MKRLPYELIRLDACFARLNLLQQEITALSIMVPSDDLDVVGVTAACHYVELSGDLRQLVGRYEDLVEVKNPESDNPGIVARCVAWACAQKEGEA